VLFATAITLVMVPALYQIAEDLAGWDEVAQGAVDPDALHTARKAAQRQPAG
jgi:hypothetical protein